MEILICIALILIVMGIGVQTFGYFSATAKLNEAKEVVDTALVTANINALTGKSITADYYSDGSEFNDPSLFKPSRYFLYFQKTEDSSLEKAWEQENNIIYGELQEGISKEVVNPLGIKKIERQKIPGKDVYELIYTEDHIIPYPVFMQSILFNPNGESIVGNEQASIPVNDMFLFFDPPFGNVNFLNDADITVLTGDGSSFAEYKKLSEITKADFINPLYLDFTGKEEKKGKVEFALQYKERADEDTGKNDDERYIMREYIEYDSRNQLSHYWD